MTIIEATEKVLRQLPDNVDHISISDLIKRVRALTYHKAESIRGTISGINNEIKNNDYIEKNFRYQKRIEGKCSACMKRKSSLPNPNETISWDSSYNSWNRNRVHREALDKHFGVFYHKNKNDMSRPFHVITAAASEGNCVKRIDDMFGISDKLVVYNCETELNVLQQYEKLGLNTINYYNDMASVIEKNDVVFDLVNFDCMKYISKKNIEYIKRFNELIDSIEFLYITMCGDVKKFRNHGLWIEEQRKRFYHFDDPSRAILISTLSNFVHLDEFRYTRNNTSREMVIHVFQGLRDEI